MKNVITYKGQDYEIKEPTIEIWQKLLAIKDWSDESEFSIALISALSELPEEEVKKAPWDEIVEASQALSGYMLQDNKKFYKDIELDGQAYTFIDLNNLSFGEFVDIDTFLQKTELEKRNEMHFLMALLYREMDNGKISEYDASKIESRANKFKKLPVKYVNGASTFFLRLEKALQGNIPLSSLKKTKMWVKGILLTMIIPVLVIFGVGSTLLSNWRMRISRKSNRLQSIP